MYIPPQLVEISESIGSGQSPDPIPVRTLLAWFGAQRRGYYIVRDIRRALESLTLETQPDFDNTWIDGSVSIVRRNVEETATGEPVAVKSQAELTTAVVPPALVGGAIADPTHRIGKLDAANRGVTFVNPNDSLARVITLMLTRNFSQIPVMTSERDVKGMVTWESIGSRLASGQNCQFAKECLDKYYEVSADESLFTVIGVIVENNYVLVRDAKDKRITGIVSATDLSLQFQQLAEPFLLLGEIEHHIRRLIENKFTQAELTSATDPTDTARKVLSVADLTLGECIRLLENPEHWQKLNLSLDRAEFVKEAHKIRDIRNDVMHFDPDPLAKEDLETLRYFASFLESLWERGIAS